ncbi:MAG: 23S rRNA (uracil(1939)-C(5))-methyltransferase RlmD, partial [Deltaproteobacteria bacterium]|nr:23S rRNA (uracil(1939)-C(5))-methyltransferase RlmD [Deltaproteobacteria bacterium]
PAPENYEAFALGLHVPGTFSKVLDIEACLLQHELGNQILREVKEYAKQSGIPAYGLKSHQGFWRYLMLRSSAHSGDWMVNLVTSEEKRERLAPLTETLSRRFSGIKTIINNINSRKASIAIGEKEIILSGEGNIKDRIGSFEFQISANSFFQTNTRGAENLYRTVEAFAALKGSEIVMDLYSGTGTIPIFLSRKCKLVIGLEIVQSAVSDAINNCRLNSISNCQFIEGDIREHLDTLQIDPDVLIVDPPRAGLHKDVLAGVMALAPRRIVYVSCNPATMARDLDLMAEKYEVVEIQPVDMFPHTYHIEAVVKMVRRQ